jgi:hypothetical protein
MRHRLDFSATHQYKLCGLAGFRPQAVPPTVASSPPAVLVGRAELATLCHPQKTDERLLHPANAAIQAQSSTFLVALQEGTDCLTRPSPVFPSVVQRLLSRGQVRLFARIVRRVRGRHPSPVPWLPRNRKRHASHAQLRHPVNDLTKYICTGNVMGRIERLAYWPAGVPAGGQSRQAPAPWLSHLDHPISLSSPLLVVPLTCCPISSPSTGVL